MCTPGQSYYLCEWPRVPSESDEPDPDLSDFDHSNDDDFLDPFGAKKGIP